MICQYPNIGYGLICYLRGLPQETNQLFTVRMDGQQYFLEKVEMPRYPRQEFLLYFFKVLLGLSSQSVMRRRKKQILHKRI